MLFLSSKSSLKPYEIITSFTISKNIVKLKTKRKFYFNEFYKVDPRYVYSVHLNCVNTIQLRN